MSRRDRWKEKQRQKVKEKMDNSVRAAQIYDALTKQTEEQVSSHRHHSSHQSASQKRKINKLLKTCITYPLTYAGIILGAFIVLTLIFCIFNSSFIKENIAFKKPVFEEYNEPKIVQIDSNGGQSTFSKSEFVKPKTNENCAAIQCDTLGSAVLNVFYLGDNDALKIGVAQETEDCFIGFNGCTVFYAYHTTYFKNLSNIKVDDRINVETPYGSYVYKVYETGVSDRQTGFNSNGESNLVLYTDEYAGITEKKSSRFIYVYARMISGPVAVE